MVKFLSRLPTGYSFSFEPSIFNTQEHLQLQSADGWNSFYAVEESPKKVVASIHFHLKDQTAMSPLKASFGGVELEECLNEDVVSDFIGFVLVELERLGVKKILIKQSPLREDDPGITNSLLGCGFKIQLTEVDSFLKVSGDYAEHLQLRKSRKLKSIQTKQWKATSLDAAHLSETYQFISSCRSRKGYSLSMSLKQVLQLANTFPERIYLFQVLDKEEIIAASICIKIKNDWLYDFYHDHNAEYDSDSPILLLMESIYDFCKSHSVHWIELGTSMKGEEVNESLLLFKSRLGASPVPKITFVKEF